MDEIKGGRKYAGITGLSCIREGKNCKPTDLSVEGKKKKNKKRRRKKRRIK